MDYKKSARTWSLLGQRGTFGTVLYELAKENNDIYALTADLCRTSGLDKFSKEFSDRFINVGIAEQNLVGVAAGIADEGKIPFVSTFANFAALRANEFVRHFMAYMDCNVKLVGLGSGFAMELFGNTHYGIEDMAVLRSMPNIVILSPADGMETAKCVAYSAEHKGPVYIRLSGKMNQPMVYRNDYEFEVGKGVVLREGEDVVVFATGSMVYVALEAAKIVQERQIYTKIINMHTIKPLDADLILQHKDYNCIVTIEEHSVTGGLGSAVAETLAAGCGHGSLLRLGIRQSYEKAGDYEYMLDKHGLTAEQAAEEICRRIG